MRQFDERIWGRKDTVFDVVASRPGKRLLADCAAAGDEEDEEEEEPE